MKNLIKQFKKALENYFTDRTKLLLSFIVLFGLVLRIMFFSGIGTSDDLAYSKYASYIQKGTYPSSDYASSAILSSRVGILYPTAFSYKIFGINDFSSVLFILLTAIGNIILAYFFGKLFHSKKTGIMAAFLMSIFPLEVVHSTKLLTDLPSSFFMALGVYIFLYSEKNNGSRNYYFLSGIFIGVGYLLRESTALIALFFLIYIIFTRQIKSGYFIVSAGFLAMLALEFFVYYQLIGNPLFRFTSVQNNLFEEYKTFNYFGRLSFPQGLFHYPYVILTNSLISYFYVLIFIAIAYFLVIKKRETYLLIFWFISLLLYLSFGSVSFSHYLPFRAEPRYLSVITIPGIVLLALFLTGKNKRIRKIVMPLSLVLLLLTSIASSYAHRNNDAVDNLRALYPHLKDSKKIIYIDDRSKLVLEYISGYNIGSNIIKYPDNFNNISDAYIIVNKAMIRRLREANKNTKLPVEIDYPPKRWKIVMEVGKVDGDSAIVYYAS